jgi:hypothetical protein
VVEISRKMWNYFTKQEGEDCLAEIGFPVSITIIHELTHAFLRSGSFKKTPIKIRRHFNVKDSGYYTERVLLHNLNMDRGLVLYANCRYNNVKWFPSNAILENCRLGTIDNKTFNLLKKDHVRNAYFSGKFCAPGENQIEIFKSQPGNVAISGRSQEEEETKKESEFFEVTKPHHGNRNKGICGCEL